MSLRVTNQTFLRQALSSFAFRNQQSSKLQQQISTGLRILRPSDDPAGLRNALSRRIEDAGYEDQLATLADVETTLNQSVSSLLEANRLIQTARATVIDAVAPGSEGVRNVHAAELESIIDRLFSIANARDDHGHLYGGTATATPPFKRTDAGIVYVGGDRTGTAFIGNTLDLEVRFTGDEIFLATERGLTAIQGETGAQIGAGTPSATGRANLVVTHTSTTFAAGSGVQAGASSAAGDTIIGPAGAHTLNIVDTSGTGQFGTVSLNGGTPVNFTNADTDLQVTADDGSVVHLDLSNITPGFNGDVDITSSGELSIEGSASTVPIDFSTSQIVTDAAGGVTPIDSSGIRSTGVDRIDYPGTQGLFGTLIAIRDELLASDGVSSEELQESLQTAIGDLSRHADRVTSVIGEQSATLESIELFTNRLQDLQVEVRQYISDVEGVDLTTAILELQNEQTLSQFGLAIVPQLFDQNLLNFLS